MLEGRLTVNRGGSAACGGLMAVEMHGRASHFVVPCILFCGAVRLILWCRAHH